LKEQKIFNKSDYQLKQNTDIILPPVTVCPTMSQINISPPIKFPTFALAEAKFRVFRVTLHVHGTFH